MAEFGSTNASQASKSSDLQAAIEISLLGEDEADAYLGALGESDREAAARAAVQAGAEAAADAAAQGAGQAVLQCNMPTDTTHAHTHVGVPCTALLYTGGACYGV